MKIYTISQDDKYKTLLDSEQKNTLQEYASQLAFGEVILRKKTESYRLVFNEDDEKKPPLSDFYTYFRPILVISKNAYAGLKNLECFPRVLIETPRDGDVAIYIDNVISGILDLDKSDYDKGANGYVVYKAILCIPAEFDHAIFRISENPQALYVTQEFKEAVEANRLKGIKFKEVGQVI